MKTNLSFSLALLFSCSAAFCMDNSNSKPHAWALPNTAAQTTQEVVLDTSAYPLLTQATHILPATQRPACLLSRRDRIAREHLCALLSKVLNQPDRQQRLSDIQDFLIFLKSKRDEYSTVNQQWIDEQVAILQHELPLPQVSEVDLTQTIVLERNLKQEATAEQTLEQELEQTRQKAEELEKKAAQAKVAKELHATELLERLRNKKIAIKQQEEALDKKIEAIENFEDLVQPATQALVTTSTPKEAKEAASSYCSIQ